MSPKIPSLTLVLSLAAASLAGAADVSVTKSGDGVIAVTIDSKPFTEYRFGGDLQKPVLYPVFGPSQVRMTRGWPLEEGFENEKQDHPHHQSIWFTHGDVNGVDFWASGEKCGSVVPKGAVEVNGATIVADHEWISPAGEVVMTDSTRIRFSASAGQRAIDYTVTLKAPGDAPVVLGDTKEGTMAIRTHPLLRLNNKAPLSAGSAVNSAGDEGKDLWGKEAAWVDYWGEIDSKAVGVAIFDHQDNPRHPTTWHARDYGLVAANPYGLSYFKKMEKGAGDLKIPAGKSVTFRYRFVFYDRDEKWSAADAYARWSKAR